MSSLLVNNKPLHVEKMDVSGRAVGFCRMRTMLPNSAPLLPDPKDNIRQVTDIWQHRGQTAYNDRMCAAVHERKKKRRKEKKDQHSDWSEKKAG